MLQTSGRAVQDSASLRKESSGLAWMDMEEVYRASYGSVGAEGGDDIGHERLEKRLTVQHHNSEERTQCKVKKKKYGTKEEDNQDILIHHT